QRLQSLSSQFDRINDHINDWIAKKLRGQTKADSNRCRLVFGEGRSTDIYFAEESASPNPIVGYVYRQDVPGQAAKRPSVYVTAAYINDCSSLIIANTKDIVAISDNLAAARQHFSPIFLLGHLDEHALGKLRSALPITPVDSDKCAAIFAFLADHPPSGYGRVYQWLEDYPLAINNKTALLIAEWREQTAAKN
ncbi:hypothetical protein FOZ63_008052, partial [Perkinsus olseni]